MKISIPKTDSELKIDVLSELKYEPSVAITDIGVLVKDGIVTLNGFATSHGEKVNAVLAAKRVAGVRAIADDIEVKLPDSLRRTDGDIADAAVTQIKWQTAIPPGAVQVTVADGRITLEGEVEWGYQRGAAEDAIQHLSGVKVVTNLITVKPALAPIVILKSIKAALKRNALLVARKIQVEIWGNKVTLRGRVRNNIEHDEAERVVWAAPGVFEVDNQLKVEWIL